MTYNLSNMPGPGDWLPSDPYEPECCGDAMAYLDYHEQHCSWDDDCDGSCRATLGGTGCGFFCHHCGRGHEYE